MISLSIADGVAKVVLDAPRELNSLDEQALADLSHAYDDAADAAARGEVRALLLPAARAARSAPAATLPHHPGERRRAGLPRRARPAAAQENDASPPRSPPPRAPASAWNWACCWPRTSSTWPRTPSSAHRSPSSEPPSIPADTRTSPSDSACTEPGPDLHRRAHRAAPTPWRRACSAGPCPRRNCWRHRAIVANVATAPRAFRASKELVARIRRPAAGAVEAMEEENAEQARLCKSEDYAEGFRAFQEKRSPVFKG